MARDVVTRHFLQTILKNVAPLLIHRAYRSRQMNLQSAFEQRGAFRDIRIGTPRNARTNRRHDGNNVRICRLARIERLGATTRDGRCVFAREWITIELIESYARTLCSLSEHFRCGICSSLQTFLETWHSPGRTCTPMQGIEVFTPGPLRFSLFKRIRRFHEYLGFFRLQRNGSALRGRRIRWRRGGATDREKRHAHHTDRPTTNDSPHVRPTFLGQAPFEHLGLQIACGVLRPKLRLNIWGFRSPAASYAPNPSPQWAKVGPTCWAVWALRSSYEHPPFVNFGRFVSANRQAWYVQRVHRCRPTKSRRIGKS